MGLRFAETSDESYAYPLLIRHLLAGAAAASGEIIYRDQVTLTYPEFVARIGRLASMLKGLGVEQGTTVAVLDWDSHRYLESYFAVPMMGAVLQTVNVRLSPQQVAYTMGHAEAEVALVHRDFLPLIDAIRAHLPKLRAVVTIDDGVEAPLPEGSAGEYEALLAAADPNFAFEDFDENALATIFYTTGTTGLPKAVSFTHRQLVLHTLACNAPFGITHGRGFGIDDVYMPMTPMFHVHAWGVPYIATMLGVRQVYPGRYDPALLVDLKTKWGVSYSHCVPTILQMVMAAGAAKGADLSNWTITIGGSALTQALAEEARTVGINVTAGYGMSETAPTVTMAHRKPRGEADADEVATLCKAGYPVPLVHVRVVDEDMRDMAHDGKARGELVVRAPWLTQAYRGDRQGSEALWRGGWMHTQDVASIDPEGSVQIKDRLKDVIKTGGEWLCSLTLEDLIAPLPGLAEAAVIGVPDTRWGERPIVVAVAAAEGPTPDKDGVNAILGEAAEKGIISRYALVDRVELVEALPKTSVGKIDKKALRAMFAGAPGDAGAA